MTLRRFAKIGLYLYIAQALAGIVAGLVAPFLFPAAFGL